MLILVVKMSVCGTNFVLATCCMIFSWFGSLEARKNKLFYNFQCRIVLTVLPNSSRSPSRGYMFPLSPHLFLFYPLFPINKTTCSLKCFSSCSLDSRNLCPVLFPTFVCLFYLPIQKRKIAFEPSFFCLESAHAALHCVQFL